MEISYAFQLFKRYMRILNYSQVLCRFLRQFQGKVKIAEEVAMNVETSDTFGETFQAIFFHAVHLDFHIYTYFFNLI